MTNEILYILLPDYAAHEIVYLSQAIASDEFAKELLLLLENDTPEHIEMYYQFNKQGFCNIFP